MSLVVTVPEIDKEGTLKREREILSRYFNVGEWDIINQDVVVLDAGVRDDKPYIYTAEKNTSFYYSVYITANGEKRLINCSELVDLIRKKNYLSPTVKEVLEYIGVQKVWRNRDGEMVASICSEVTRNVKIKDIGINYIDVNRHNCGMVLFEFEGKKYIYGGGKVLHFEGGEKVDADIISGKIDREINSSMLLYIMANEDKVVKEEPENKKRIIENMVQCGVTKLWAQDKVIIVWKNKNNITRVWSDWDIDGYWELIKSSEGVYDLVRYFAKGSMGEFLAAGQGCHVYDGKKWRAMK